MTDFFGVCPSIAGSVAANRVPVQVQILPMESLTPPSIHQCEVLRDTLATASTAESSGNVN